MQNATTVFNEKHTQLLNNLGAFFAFSKQQFDKSKVDGVTYVDVGLGCLCPVDNAKALNEGVDTLYKEMVAQRLAEEGKDEIIKYELSNHEVYYSGDISEVVSKLVDYGISRSEVVAVFNREWPLQDI